MTPPTQRLLILLRCCFALPLLVGAASAHAQSGAVSSSAPANGAKTKERWLVLPVLVQPASKELDPERLSAGVEAALRDAGKEVLTSSSAAALFETNHSTEPVQLDNDEMSRLLRRVSEAARHLALGELVQAQQSMEGVYALSGPARDFLNREAARARKIFDNCLMAAYLWERGNDHQHALRQMLDCSRSFPGFRPEGRAYPPELRELFDQATLRLGQMQATTLLVRSGDRAGCGVRLNGIEVGKSPMSFSDVRSGTTRVQLECEPGVPGRIHEIELQPGDNHLVIDPDFDSALHTKKGLWLAYDREEDRKARADADAQVIARVLHVEHVVGLWISGSDGSVQVGLRPLLTGPSKEVAVLLAARDAHEQAYEPTALSAAIDKLLHPPEPVVPPPPAAPVPPPSAAEAQPPSAAEVAAKAAEPSEDLRPLHDQTHPVVGAALAVLGAGGMVTGWVLYADRQSLRTPLYPSGIPLATLDNFRNRGTMALLATGLGAGVLALSDYFWLPTQDGTPAWAYAAGAAGLALGATGVAFAVFGRHCEIGAAPVVCQAFSADAAFGPLLALQSLPLLAVPITYLLRRAVQGGSSQLRVSAEVHDRAASFGLQGRF